MEDGLINKFKYYIDHIKQFFNGLNFQVKLILSLILSISVFITLCAFLIIQDIQSNIDNQVLKLNHNLKTTQTLAQLGAQILIPDYKNNKTRNLKLEDLINSTNKSNSEIYFVVFTDNAGNVLVKSKFAHLYDIFKNHQNNIAPPNHVPFIKISYSKNGKLLTLAEPLQFNSNFVGWVWVGFADAGFTVVGSKKELLAFLFEIFLLVWILSVIGAIVNSLIITRPLRKLEKGAKAISEGRFGFQLPLKGFLGKELSQLVKAFNKMSKRLQQYEESNIATLSSERNKFESVVMSIADGVIVLDKENTIQIINPAAGKLLNRSGDELLGQRANNIWDVKTNEQVLNYLNSIRITATEGHPYEYLNLELIRENKNLKLIITPLYDTNNEKLGAVIVVQDRTKEAEVELIKQEFISNVSHELRTPITSIKCYVDTLCSHANQIDEKIRNEFLSIVNEETDRLSSLVNDVLELSRLESHSTKIQLNIQEIYPSIDYVLKATMVLANKKSIKLLTDINENLPLLNINQEYIERILVNLISNAIKYTPGNGIVKLVVKEEKEFVLFQVIDNGIGIQEEHIPLIFERFYRIENKVHTIKGTGLGLTIVKKSIEQHSGKISVRSKLGEGSIFEFTLPIPDQNTGISKIKDFKKDSKVAKTA